MKHSVKMYTLSTCSHCKAVKKFFQENNIAFEFIDVDLLDATAKANALNEVVQYNPQRSFPTIVIGKDIIIGFREQDLKKALGI